jgi:hypothetical protein
MERKLQGFKSVDEKRFFFANPAELTDALTRRTHAVRKLLAHTISAFSARLDRVCAASETPNGTRRARQRIARQNDA